MSSESRVDKEYVATKEDLQKSSLLFCAPEAIDLGNWRDVIAKPEISARIVAIVVDVMRLAAYQNGELTKFVMATSIIWITFNNFHTLKILAIIWPSS